MSFESYSNSSLRCFLPEDLSSRIDESSLEHICYDALVSAGDASVNFITQDAGSIQECSRFYRMFPENFEIDKDVQSGEWLWKIDAEDPLRDDARVQLSGRRDENGMRTLRHDIVGMAISTAKTDVPLSNIFPGLRGLDIGRLTPDYHLSKGGCNYFVELGTTRADDPAGALLELRRKCFKYGQALEEIEHSIPCFLITIIVGSKFVVSNYVINGIAVERLVLHMNLAIALEMRIAGLNLPGLMVPRESHKEVLVELIESDVKHIDIDMEANGPLDITSDYIKRVCKQADQNKVRSYFIQYMNDSLTQIRSKWSESVPTGRDDPRKIALEKTLRSQDSRTITKAIVGLPLFVCKRSSVHCQDITPFSVAGPNHESDSVLNLWRAALYGYANAEENFDFKRDQTEEELFFTDKSDQDAVSERNKEFRKTAHRCNIKGRLTDDDMRVLALDGLWGKKRQGDLVKLEKERVTKLPYNYDIPTTDIDSFLEDEMLYDEYEYAPYEVPCTDLVSKSFTSLGQPLEALDAVQDLARSKLFCALQLMSDVAMEITLSLKQHTKSHQVLLKKLAHYEVYLLLLPTKASEHIFYSLFCPGGQEGIIVLSGLPFKEMKPTVDGGWYTDFSSFRPEKLANPATADVMFLGLASYFCHHYRARDISLSSMREDSRILSMINFTLLVRLENKLCTEETLTVSRYMYMEMFKTSLCVKSDPYRLISKFDPCVRSRLQVFSLKRFFSVFDTMLENKPYKYVPEGGDQEDPEEEAACNDHWRNLLNPYTLRPEESAAKMVSLFYVGYGVDKDQTSQSNADFKTIEKAVKKDREFNMEEVERSNGSWDEFTEPPKEKQFSINTIIYGVEIMERHLYTKYGEGWKTVLKDKVFQKLSGIMSHDLATLKASARIDHMPWGSLPSADQILRERKPRYKAIEAVILEIGLFHHNPYISLSAFINAIEISSRGVLCDLFKKNQHGGLREIYVLTIKSRVVALYLETIARTICFEFECETMTHPNLKMEVIERHKQLASNYAYRKNMNLTEYQCSADKKSWNHNLVMPALAVPLIRLMPSEMHGSIQRVFNMWNGRLLQLPRGVLKLLVNGTPLNSPTYQVMLKEFDDPGSTGLPRLFDYAGAGHCILTTGMMQGILHYTSSLLHVSYLHVTKVLIKTYVRASLPKVVCMVDQMCSSDDSATIISLMDPHDSSELDLKRSMIMGEAICETLKVLCQLSCFTNSEKSTMGSSNHLEFNSEFIIGNTVAVPTLKWLFACYSVTEAEDLLLRSQTFYNLMSQVNAAGLPAFNTTVVQVSQAILHYRLLGSSTNQFFQRYSNMLLNYPDPALGFFIIDHVLVPGVLGYSFHHWMHAQRHNLFRIRKKSAIDGTLGFNPEGGIVETFKIRYGGSVRYEKLVETVSGGTVQDLRDKVNSKPMVLYSHSGSREDAEIKIAAKCLLPGTAQALKRGNNFIQGVATSAYALQTYSFTKTEVFFRDDKTEKSMAKISLIAELSKRMQRDGDLDQLEGNSAEALCFPNYKRFREYAITLLKYRGARKIPVKPMRCRKSTMRFSQATSAIPISLYDLVREKWAGRVISHSHQLKERSWQSYKAVMPWLDETLDGTLEKSPFMDHVELHNFVSSTSKTSRKFTRVGPAIRASNPLGQIEQIARRAYQDGFILKISTQDVPDNYRLYRDRRTSLGLALEIPVAEFREMYVKIAIKQNPYQPGELDLIKDRSRRESKLSIIAAKICGVPDQEIKEAIDRMGEGLFISWKKMQKRDENKTFSKGVSVKWMGSGVVMLSNKDMVCEVLTEDDTAVKIKTNNAYRLLGQQTVILRMLAEQGIYPAKAMKYPNCSRFLTKDGVSSVGPGTPIVEMPNSPSLQPSENEGMTFEIKIDRKRISLIQTGSVAHAATILTYNTLIQEFSGAQDANTTEEVWSAWYNQSRLDANVASDLIEATLEQRHELRGLGPYNRDSKESEETVRFLKETLLARLRFKGYSPGMPILAEGSLELEENYNITTDEDYAAMQQAMLTLEEDVIRGRGDELLNEVMSAEAAAMESESDLLVQRDLASIAGILDEPVVSEILESYRIKQMPMELVTNQLTSQYGIMQFWDPLINQVSSVNPTAWKQLLGGAIVHGVRPSRHIIKLLTSRNPTPALMFGRSIGEQISDEAMVAIYARSRKSSNRSSLSEIYDGYSKLFQEKASELIKKSELFKGRDDLMDEVFAILAKASEETLQATEVSESEDSDSDVSDVEEDFQKKRLDTIQWVKSHSMSLLTSDELSVLHRILVQSSPLMDKADDDVIAVSSYMRGVNLPLKGDYQNDKVHVFYCLLGDQDDGHWVSIVKGMQWNSEIVDYYDSLFTTNHVETAVSQVARLLPDLKPANVAVATVPTQSTPSCGHSAFLWSSHKIMGWQIPQYTDHDLRVWVREVLTEGVLFQMSSKPT